MPGKAGSNARQKEDGSGPRGKDTGTKAGGVSGSEGSQVGSGSGSTSKGTGGSGGSGTGGAGSGRSGRRGRVGVTGVVEKPPVADPLVDAPPQPKRKTGRKSNAEKAQEAVDAANQQRAAWAEGAKELAPTLETVVPIPFGIIAKRRGAHWNLKSEETKRIAYALGVIIEKHMPSFIFNWQEELVLAMLLGGAIAGRLTLDRKAAEERKARKVQAQDVSTGDNGNAADGEDDLATALSSTLP